MLARFLAPTLLFASALAAQNGGPAALSLEEKENFLKSAKLVEMKELSMGVTNSKRAVLDDGKLRHDAHIQSVMIAKAEFEGTRGKEINFRDSYKFNMAAYELDKLLELHMIPPSVERKVAGSSAAVTWWLDDMLMMEVDRVKKKLNAPDNDQWNRQMNIVRVFDQLIYNTDRNLQNLLITNDWKLIMIDHTRAFRMYKTLLSPGNLKSCDRKLLTRLRNLDKEEVKRRLKPWLTSMEIDGLLARRDVIVKFFDAEIAKKGEAVVLYEWL